MLSLFTGFVLGLGAAVPIGPVNVEIARRTLRGGFSAGFFLGCGAVTVDVTFAALTSLSLMRFLDRPGLRVPLLLGGTALLAYLGVLCLIAALRTSRQPDLRAQVSTTSIRGTYLTGVAMTLLNPMTLAFWLVAVPAAGASTASGSLPVVCAGVFAGTLTWVLCFAGSIHWLRRFQQKHWMAIADLIGGMILLAFAAAGIWSLIRDFAR